MEFSTISDSTKKAILESSLASIESELYRELIYSGIDPDSFTGISDIRDSDNPEVVIRSPRFEGILARIAFVKERLESI
jgi:hypothetical protein